MELFFNWIFFAVTRIFRISISSSEVSAGIALDFTVALWVLLFYWLSLGFRTMLLDFLDVTPPWTRCDGKLENGSGFFFPKNKFLIGLKGLVFSGHFFVTESASRWRRRAHLSSTDAQTHARTHARTYGQRRGFHLENGGKKRSRLPWNYRAPVQSNPTTCHDIFFIIIIEETSTVKMAHFDRINLS